MDSHYCNILSVAMNRGRAGKTPACRVQHGMWPVVLSWMVSGSHPDGDDDVDRCAATKKARIMVAEGIVKRAPRQSDRPRNPRRARSKAGTVLIEWNVSASGRTGAQGLASVRGARLQSPKRVFFSCGCTGVGEGREYRVMW